MVALEFPLIISTGELRESSPDESAYTVASPCPVLIGVEDFTDLLISINLTCESVFKPAKETVE